MAKRLEVRARILPDGQSFTASGRDGWALLELIAAGPNGCTPIDNPAPRWSAYVHALRHERGLDIETVNEGHGGQFAGTHARYVLHSRIEILGCNDRTELAVAA